MKVQLLLLLALAGPFCAFTRASPTDIPIHNTEGFPFTATGDVRGATEVATDLEELITGPHATEPAVASEELVTNVITDAPPAITEEAVVETEAPIASTAAVPQPLVTEAPVVTAAPTVAEEVDVPAETTAAVEADEQVLVEEDGEDGLSSGQVVGIVIGALLAVVIVIAVVIAVVRRMGKYSSAKNKKPTKKDSILVSPLRKKSAKQQERAKFWKF